jgi:hypothetical protein
VTGGEEGEIVIKENIKVEEKEEGDQDKEG